MDFSARHLRGFSYAKQGFLDSDYTKRPVGAAYIERGRIIIASNTIKTAPIAKALGSYWERLHAEMCCLQGLDNCKDGELYIYRARRDTNELANSRPCQFCLPHLKTKNLRHVYYTNVNGFNYLDLRNE
jgi:tRNA(Arg) A34 adenosine deaminase TadA